MIIGLIDQFLIFDVLAPTLPRQEADPFFLAKTTVHCLCISQQSDGFIPNGVKAFSQGRTAMCDCVQEHLCNTVGMDVVQRFYSKIGKDQFLPAANLVKYPIILIPVRTSLGTR